MVLDSKLQSIRDHFGVIDPEDWTWISPAEIASLPNVGPATVNHLRLMLANRGLTLNGDGTPEYWQAELSVKRGASQISQMDGVLLSPLKIYVDTAEQQPFTFQGFKADAAQGHKPLAVQWEKKHLGPTHGDYTAEGLEDYCHVERKGMGDWHGTVLGWGDRREQFTRTLEYLAEIPLGLIVTECTLGQAIERMPENGKKSKSENQKIFFRQVMAWLADYGVPWIFCDTRRLAEQVTFRHLERTRRKLAEEQKRTQKLAAIENYEL